MSTDQISTLRSDIKEIKQLLQGNDLDDNDNGMIGRQLETQKKLFNLEKVVYRYLWMGTGMSILASGIMAILALLIEYHRN